MIFNENISCCLRGMVLILKWRYLDELRSWRVNRWRVLMAIHVQWNIIFQSYYCFDKNFKAGISRCSQWSPVQRGSPYRERTTHSGFGVLLKLKYWGRTSLKTPHALVLSSNIQRNQRRVFPGNVSLWQFESSAVKAGLVITSGRSQVLARNHLLCIAYGFTMHWERRWCWFRCHKMRSSPFWSF